jgi:hypothetical protein
MQTLHASSKQFISEIQRRKFMENAPQSVETHYSRGDILNSILRALREMGKDIAKLIPSDLAPVDELHIRGREATIELASRASLKPILL